jgi:hypothetical protein
MPAAQYIQCIRKVSTSSAATFMARRRIRVNVVYKSTSTYVSQETLLSTSENVHINANVLQRNCTRYGLQSLLLLKELVIWGFIYKLSVTEKTWNRVSLQVLNFLYSLSTYYISTTYIKINYEKFWKSCISNRPIPKLLSIWIRNMTRA